MNNSSNIPPRISGSSPGQRAMQDALRQSEERFRLLIEAVKDYAIFMLDTEGFVTSWNEGAARTKGYSASEIIGQHFSRFYTPEDRAHGKPARLLKTARDTGRVHDEGWRMRKDGSRFWASVTITAVYDEHRILRGFAKVTQDITERRDSEIMLRQKQQEIYTLQKMETIGRLAGGIAHDFNNMIAGILGCAESIEATVGPRSILAEEIEQIKGSCDRSKALVRQLTAFSRRQLATPRTIQLNTVLHDIQPLVLRSIPANITLTMDLEPELPLVQADVGQIEQIFFNLVLNARDAMPRGGHLNIRTEKVWVDESTEVDGFPNRPNQAVVITVSDTGIGMTPEVRDKIFEPFFTTKELGKGSGLGLSTVYGIVQQNQGGVYVYSRPEIGTTFKIFLPSSNASHTIAMPAASHHGREVSARDGELILVVEDEPLVLRNTVRALEDRGYRVLSAHNADEAFQLFETAKNEIRLILTDVMMPGISGKDLAVLIKKESPEMPVLYMSGYAADIIADHGLITTEIDFLEKPFSSNVLATKIREILDRKRSH